MPLFDYRCGECDHEFEALQGINDDALEVCPECHQSALKKLAAAPAFTFKGSGWYKDLYGSAKSDSGKKDSGSTTVATGDTGAKTPAAKSDSGSAKSTAVAD